MTGLLAWKHGQPGQVGNEAALTVVTSAGVRLVTLNAPEKTAVVAVFSFQLDAPVLSHFSSRTPSSRPPYMRGTIAPS